MATSPEQFFVKDVSSTQQGGGCHHHAVPSDEDMMLPYISRMLMEDDDDAADDNKLSHHPALLQVEEPFAQILSSPSLGGISEDVLQGGGSDGRTPDYSSSSRSRCASAAGAFLELEDDVLPGDDSGFMVGRESSVLSKKRYASRDDGSLEEEVVTRRSKADKDTCAHDMLEDMMLSGHETYIRDMEKLRIAMANEKSRSNGKGGGGSKKASFCNVVDIRSLLILCAHAVAANDGARARELLKQINQHASETGDATQRLAQCFARGLEARLLGTGSQLWQLQLASDRLSTAEFLKAHNLYMAACGFNMAVIGFSTMTIMQAMAMAGRRSLHIVDYGMRFGFQKKWELVCNEDLDRRPDEVLVVNDHFNFSTLMDESVFFDNPSPRDTVLLNVRKMRPDVFIQSILNNSNGCSYLSRFREALFYYTAMFDIFDATMPRESRSRVVLEQGLFGRSALNVVACEGIDLLERPERYRQWQARNQRAGLRQLPLQPTIVSILKEEVRSCHHRDFLICEDGKWLLQGWMGRILFAQSTWVAEDSSYSE
ncbi:hypothetical protein ZEAMMB73_Zm00001d007248 [Zea mays]|uniref:Uncharacterized protein n=1 Tax=Zea mays TaxID=4577 RepID=A0A1D6F535_MAIZE